MGGVITVQAFFSVGKGRGVRREEKKRKESLGLYINLKNNYRNPSSSEIFTPSTHSHTITRDVEYFGYTSGTYTRCFKSLGQEESKKVSLVAIVFTASSRKSKRRERGGEGREGKRKG